MQFIRTNGRGMLLCLILALPAWWLGSRFPVIGGPILAILLGMLVAIPLKEQGRMAPGIKFTSKKVLQWAVILLGFGLDLTVVLRTGKQSLPIILCTITASLVIAFVLHKVLHIPSKISTLIGVGSSICGGSAIAATAPVIDADDEEVAQAISVIFFFNVLAAILFPILGHAIGFDTTSGEAFGIFAGTAVNDTSSVTAAAATWDSMWGLGTATLDKAVTVKLTRYLGHHPHHPGPGVDPDQKGLSGTGQEREPEGHLPLLHPLLYCRLPHHHPRRSLWGGRLFLCPAENAEQIPDRGRHGRHRPEHEHR